MTWLPCAFCGHKPKFHVNARCTVRDCPCLVGDYRPRADPIDYESDEWNDAILVANDVMAEMAEGEPE